MSIRSKNRRPNSRAAFVRLLKEQLWGGIKESIRSRFEWMKSIVVPVGRIRVPAKQHSAKYRDNVRNLATPEGLEVRKLLAGDVYISSAGNSVEGAFPGGFELRIDGSGPAAPLVVNYSVATSVPSGVLATPTDDYPVLTGMVTFGVGQTQAFVNVAALDDDLLEPTEVVQISLTSTNDPTNFPISGTLPIQRSIAVVDQDSATLAITAVDPVASELGDTGQFLLSLIGPGGISMASATDTTVTLSIGGSAANGVDYTSVPTVVTVPANAESLAIDITPIADTNNFEGDEDVVVSVTGIGTSHPSLAYSSAPATVTISDPVRAVAALSTATTTVTESGSSKIVYTVSLDSAPGAPVTLAIDLVGGTASAADFSPATSQALVTFGATQTVQSVTVNINDDNIVEGNETVLASLTYVGGSVAVDGTAATANSTILANDGTTLSVSAGTVAESAGTANVTFSLAGGKVVGTNTTFNLAFSGSAESSDYMFPGVSQVVIPANSGSTVVPVSITNDSLVEGDENLVISLSGPAQTVPITLSTTKATLTIQDDDIASYSVTGASAVESAGVVFNVSLTNKVETAAVLNYSLSHGTTSASDLTGPLTGLVTVAAGSNTAAITVGVVNDSLVESAETFNLALTGVSSAVGSVVPGASTMAVGTIIDDDSATVNLLAPTATINEPDSVTEQQPFLVVLNQPVSVDTTVSIGIGGGSASLGSDYSPPTAVVVIPASQQVASLPIDFFSDDLVEDNETVIASITGVSAGTFAIGAGSSATMTIIDDDFASVSLSPTAVTVTEGVGAVFNFTQSSLASTDTVINYTIAPGAAGPTGATTADYSTTTVGTLTIPAFASTAAVTIGTVDDTIVEPNQSFTVNFSKVSSDPQVSFAAATSTVVIQDNDALSVSISGPTGVTELNTGSATTLSYTVALTTVSDADVVVGVQTVNGTATGGADFTAVNQSVTIAAGSLTASVPVVVLGDNAVEADETFEIELVSPIAGGASVTIDSAAADVTVTIDDDDTATLTFTGPSAAIVEGTSSAGTTDAVFTLQLSAPSSVATVVDLTTANGSAVAPGDFTALVSQPVTIAQGTTIALATVAIAQDAIDEAAEVFSLSAAISNTNGASIVTSGATTRPVTISDDDNALVSVRTVNDTVTEGNSALFELSLTASSAPVTVFYQTNPGSATSADYTSTTASIVLAASTTGSAQTVAIATTSDSLVETQEDFSLSITSISGGVSHSPAILTASDIVTISDSNAATLELTGPATGVSESGGPVNFTIALGARTQDTVVSYTTSPGTAVAGGDYTATNGLITIAANASATTAVVPVTLTNDLLLEDDEDFSFSISLIESNGVSIAVGNSSQTATILDDDSATVTVQRFVDAAETASGPTGATGRFLVSLSNPSETATTVAFTLTGTAMGVADYLVPANTVVIPANSLTINVDIAPVNDTLVEGPETVVLSLTGVNGDPSIGHSASPATITIDDNDAALVNVSGTSVAESVGNVTFTISLTKPSATAVTVPYSLSGTATAPSDFTGSTSGTVVFAAGQTTAEVVPLAIIDDNVVEGTETISLSIGTITGNSLVSAGTGTNAITISDNDAAVATIIPAATPIAEGTSAQFIVLLSSVAQGDTTVTVNLSGQATTADYTSPAGTVGTVVIPGGSPSGSLFVAVTDDNLVEGNETLIATIAGINGTGNLTSASPTSATIVINNNDQALATVGNTLSVSEATATADVQVTLSNPSDTATVVSYSIADGTAKRAGAASLGEQDYTGSIGAITIAAQATVGTISVPITNDVIVEGTETFTVQLTSASNASSNPSVGVGGANTTTVSIYDNDSASLSVSSGLSVTEGTGAGTTNVTFTINQSSVSASDTTVSYSTTPGTATAADYTATSGAVVISAGQQDATVVVPITRDTLIETNEVFALSLTGKSGDPQITIGAATGNMTIYDDDSSAIRLPQFSQATESEGNALIVVSLTNPTASPLTLNYAVTPTGVAPADANDFNPAGLPSGLLTIAPSATQATLTIALNNDDLVELDETFLVSISNLQSNGASISIDSTANTSTVTIQDDDVTALRIFTDMGPTTSVPESVGDSGLFYLSLSSASSTPTTVTYSIGGDATVGSDYAAFPSTAVIPALAKSHAISVNVVDDTSIEDNEVIQISLVTTSNPDIAINLSLNDVADATIIDNDGMATLTSTTSPLTITEGGNAVFILSLTGGVSATDTVVSYDLVGSPKFYSPDNPSPLTVTGNDTSTSLGAGMATIAAGQTSVAITVNTIDDSLVESDETIALANVVKTSGASAIMNNAVDQTVVVQDNDTADLVIVGDLNGYETGPINGRFRLILTKPVDTPITVSAQDYYVGPANIDEATSGTDFVSLPTSLVIPAGSLALPVPVTVIPDAALELAEKVRYDATGLLSPDYSGRLSLVSGSDSAVITIFDSNTAALTVSDTSVNEASGPAQVLISLSNPTPVATSVVYSLNDGTAVQGQDYSGSTGTVVIPAMSTTAAIPVTIINDDVVEAVETLSLNLVSVIPNGSNVSFVPGESADVTITSEDTAVANVVNASSVEGNAMVVQVSLSKVSDQPTTVTLAAALGTAEAADYTPNATLTAVVAASTTLASVTLGTSVDDTKFEGAETVLVSVTAVDTPYAGSITPGSTGTATILDNDLLTVSLSAPVATTNENDSPSTGQFLVSLSGDIDEPVTLFYDVGGSASLGIDYTGPTGSVVIPTSSSTASIVVDAINDGLNETDETVNVTLSSVQGAANSLVTGLGSAATVTIQDVNTPVATAQFLPTNVNEGDTATLAISLSTPATSSFTIAYGYGGDATIGDDYSGLTGSVVFAPGDTVQNVVVPTVDDSFVEADETVAVTLGTVTSGPGLAAAVGSPSQATLTIVDNDDSLLTVSKISNAVDPNTGAATDGVFLINLSSPSQTNTTVSFTLGGTATEVTEYAAVPRTIVIPANQMDGFVTISPVADDLVGNDETVEISLSSFTGNPFIEIVSTSDKTATLNIVDLDQSEISLDIVPTTVDEGNAFVIQLSLSKATEDGVVLNLGPTGTASAADVSGLPSTISLAAGATTAAITVTAVDDAIVEADESLTLTASSSDYAGRMLTTSGSTDGIVINDTDTLQVVGTPIVNGGTADTVQRSRVTQMTLVLNGEVAATELSKFIVKNRATLNVVDLTGSTFVYNPGTGQTTVTLKFSGAETEFGSLKDGNYQLDIAGTLVDVHGNVFDGNGDTTTGDGYSFGALSDVGFYRLYGDSNGDRTVGFVDLLAFRAAYGLASEVFDKDQSGDVGFADLLALRAVYDTTLSY